LKGLGKVGWVVAFFYCACAALRLARFNTNIGIVDKRFFQGLPSPAAAALVAGFIWVMDDAGFKNVSQVSWLTWTALGTTLFAGFTMVTNVPFYSFKVVGLKRTVPFIVIVAIALGIAIIQLHPPIVLFALFCTYSVSGYAVYVWRRVKGKPVSVIATSTDEPDEQGLHR
jgi:CDP-diacylglycerol---serine O-phosphatidyltransferase